MTIFKKLHRQGTTIVLVTHEQEIAAYAKRILFFRDGQLIKEEIISVPPEVNNR
jgi:putative ABC transport system ATP-binding protein